MNKQVLRNPRARRMLNLLQPGLRDPDNPISLQEPNKEAMVFEVDIKKSYNLRDNPTSLQEPTKEAMVIKTDLNKSYNLRDQRFKHNYNERDEENEDFSSETSEYVPSPYRERSDTPSITSSIGGDSTFIDDLIHSSTIPSPLNISNLSLVLDTVDFVASPSAIYKVMNNRVGTHKPNEAMNSNVRQALPNSPVGAVYRKQQLANVCEFSNRATNSTPDYFEDETLTPAKGDVTLKPNEVVIYATTASELNSTNENIDRSGINACTDELDETVSLISSSNDQAREESIHEQEIVTETLNDTEIIHSSQLSSSVICDDVQAEVEGDTIEHSELLTSENQVNLTRKRKCNKNNWRDNKNKRLKNSGEAYEGVRSKKSYTMKMIGPVCSCKKKCNEIFSSEQREDILKAFYGLKSHELQWQYIARHVIANPVKRITLERKNNRTQTFKYNFPLEGCEVPVCKIFFLNTLSISEQVVYTALEKIKKDMSLTDGRGTHMNRPHRMHVNTKESIVAHINLFPAMESHYVRKDSTRQYLSEQLNISKMYRLYKSWFAHQDQSTEYLASKRQYETIFNTEYNYSFFKPKKDLCAICSLYEQADVTRKASLEENYRKHLQRKERVREIKREEKATVDATNTTIAVFDLEKVLSVPQSEVGIFHYKRKYPIYNFTVFDTVKKLGYCYVWHLSIAKRGSTEIGSCLLQFIQHEAQRGIKNISFYSDGCAGQNKNRFIFAMFLHAIKSYGLQSITHRFFETGHSQSEGDSMHSCVERAMKNKVLFTPDQVYSVILNSKVTGEKYNVKEMEQCDIYDLKCLISGKNWLKDTQGRKISWTKIMEVKATHTRPYILQFKYDFGDEYLELNTDEVFGRPRRGRLTKTIVEPNNVEESLRQMYHQPIALSKPLHDDLLGLCASEAIPKHYHGFYESLSTCGHQNSHVHDFPDEDDSEE